MGSGLEAFGALRDAEVRSVACTSDRVEILTRHEARHGTWPHTMPQLIRASGVRGRGLPLMCIGRMYRRSCHAWAWGLQVAVSGLRSRRLCAFVALRCVGAVLLV